MLRGMDWAALGHRYKKKMKARGASTSRPKAKKLPSGPPCCDFWEDFRFWEEKKLLGKKKFRHKFLPALATHITEFLNPVLAHLARQHIPAQAEVGMAVFWSCYDYCLPIGM